MTKITILMGNFQVIEVRGRTISVGLGNSVVSHFTVPFDHSVKIGDELPLFTEVPLCPPSAN